MLAILLVPCCILYVIYTRTVAKSVAENVETIARNELSVSVDLLDSALQSYQDRAYFFARSDGYQAYDSSHSLTAGTRGQFSSLQITSDTNYIYNLDSDINCIFVYFHDVDTIIAAGTMSNLCRPSVFFTQYFHDSAVGDMEARLLSFEQPAILPVDSVWGTGGAYLALVYPIGSGGSDRVVICIPAETFSRYFELRSIDISAGTLIFSEDGRFLFSCGIGREDMPSWIDEELNTAEAEQISRNGRNYRVIRQTSSRNGLQAISLLPMDNAIYNTLFNVGRFFAIFLLLTGIIGILVILLLTRLNYMPISRLTQKARQSMPTGGSPGVSEDDINLISRSLTYLQGENSKLSTEMEAMIPTIRMLRLQHLLSGSYNSLEEFNTDCEQVGISFALPCFYVSVFLLPEDLAISRNEIVEVLTKELCRHIESCYISAINRRQMVFLHNVAADGLRPDFAPFNAALAFLTDTFSLSSTVGVGHIYAGTQMIGQSLLQAVSALDYRSVKGRCIVISYDDINLSPDSSYPHQAIRQLTNAVMLGDQTQVQARIDALLQYVYDSNMPLFLARNICADIVKCCLSGSGPKVFHAYSLSTALFDLSECSSVSELFTIIRRIRRILEEDAENAPAQDPLIDEIVRYIEDNYCRCDFSMQEVAEHFSMLPSNLSSFFKEHMQCNMLDYLIELRMNHARRLLKTTDLPLKEISESVGYYNVSSFIRRFKTHEGITPNNYRSKIQ